MHRHEVRDAVITGRTSTPHALCSTPRMKYPASRMMTIAGSRDVRRASATRSTAHARQHLQI
jgi:hypothetical protein